MIIDAEKYQGGVEEITLQLETFEGNDAQNLAYYQELFPNFTASLSDDSASVHSQPSDTPAKANPEVVVDEYFTFARSLDLRRKQIFNVKNPVDFWTKHEKVCGTVIC